MKLVVRASDLYYRYPKDTLNRHLPKFCGKPDDRPFNRDDIYEVLPMLAAVMESLGSNEQRVLQEVEEIMIRDMPSFILSRDEVFDFLTGCMGERLESR